MSTAVSTSKAPKRGRKKREPTNADGRARTQRERQSAVGHILATLRQRCTELEVSETETSELLGLVADALKDLRRESDPLKRDATTTATTTTTTTTTATTTALTTATTATTVQSAAATANTAESSSTSASVAVSADAMSTESAEDPIDMDHSHSIVRAGRDYMFKDAEDEGKFKSIADALKHYQEKLAPQPRDNEAGTKKLFVDFFCVFCLSDPYADLCAFCGCRKCFGKFSQKENIYSCSECEMEYHSYCCTPLNAAQTLWACDACKDKVEEREAKKRSISAITSEVELISAFSLDDSLGDRAVRKNKVGRPRGSLNKASEFRLSLSGIPSDDSRIPGVDSALAVLQSDSLVRLTADDLNVLEQTRLWGPIYDLEAVLLALESKKRLLFELMVESDPTCVAALEALEAKINEDVQSRTQDDFPRLTSSRSQAVKQGKSGKLNRRRKRRAQPMMLGFRGKGRRRRTVPAASSSAEDALGLDGEACAEGDEELHEQESPEPEDDGEDDDAYEPDAY